LHQDRVSVSNWNTLQYIVIKHWSSEPNFTTTARKPIFAPRNNKWVRHVCIRRYSRNKGSRKTCRLRA
jgi:hypothetical protein